VNSTVAASFPQNYAMRRRDRYRFNVITLLLQQQGQSAGRELLLDLRRAISSVNDTAVH
jgi:hypothetical protein